MRPILVQICALLLTVAPAEALEKVAHLGKHGAWLVVRSTILRELTETGAITPAFEDADAYLLVNCSTGRLRPDYTVELHRKSTNLEKKESIIVELSSRAGYSAKFKAKITSVGTYIYVDPEQLLNLSELAPILKVRGSDIDLSFSTSGFKSALEMAAVDCNGRQIEKLTAHP